MVKRAACYCRVSTKKEDQLKSMEMQKQFFTEYCEKNNEYKLYNIYADEGISGKSLKNRKEFDKMIKDAQRGCFDVILVKDFSRFARNTVDLLSIVRMLKNINIEVIFVNYNTTTMQDSELVLTLMGALAQEESQALSKKLKLSKNITAERGRVPNFVFGYDRIDKYTLVPNEYEANWVKKIFDLYVNGGMGTTKIAEYLNNNNVKSKKNMYKAWSQRVVSSILQNELYIGKVVNKKSEVEDFKTGKRKEISRDKWLVVEKPEFRIISDELFKSAQSLLEYRKNSLHLDKKRPSSKYPLSNLLVCAKDGYSFRRCRRQYSENGKIYTWWTCSYRNAKGASSCNNNINVDEKQMHLAIIDFFHSICGNKEEIAKQVSDYVRNELKNRYDNHNYNGLLSELKRLELKQSRLLDLYADSFMSKEQLKSKLDPIKNRIDEIKEAITIHGEHENVSIDIEKMVRNFISKIDAKTDDLLSNKFLKTIFQKFVVHEDGRIIAVMKIDCDAGVSMDIPFGEIVDDEIEPTIPEYNNSTQGCNRETDKGEPRAC